MIEANNESKNKDHTQKITTEVIRLLIGIAFAAIGFYANLTEGIAEIFIIVLLYSFIVKEI